MDFQQTPPFADFTATITSTNSHLYFTDDVDLTPSIENFCGTVHKVSNGGLPLTQQITIPENSTCYLCGNIKYFINSAPNGVASLTHFIAKNKCFVIIPFSYGNEGLPTINLDELPTVVNGVGVYFKNHFKRTNIFTEISLSHNFYSLTESDKPSNAFRTGVYLSKVTKQNDTFTYNLLRCSSNLGGATENFREIDNSIVDSVNGLVEQCFTNYSPLNHVLAQIYTNTVNENGQERKAKIKDHSDKTKDMPIGGLIAFCTFYDRNPTTDSELTKMKFMLKPDVSGTNHVKRFEIPFNQNSVFIIPLSTNRLYTHEIIPSNLPINKLPTRLGYVIRCSNAVAVFRDGKTTVNGKELVKPKGNDIGELKKLYFEENVKSKMVNYDCENASCFSMNEGDYLEPIY